MVIIFLSRITSFLKIGGIKYKINYFCDGRADEFIEEKLKEGKCVLIFDGVDDIAQEIDQKKILCRIQ